MITATSPFHRKQYTSFPVSENLDMENTEKTEEDKERERVKMSQNESTVFNTAIKPLCFYFEIDGQCTAIHMW